jgi:mono/diheme cytochrome c family protein
LAVLVLISALIACNREVAGGKADGPAVFREACSRCHGESGAPSAALRAQLGVKDLTGAEVQARLSDEDIREQIRSGSENKRMPGFGSTLSDAQLDALVAHVRALAAP